MADRPASSPALPAHSAADVAAVVAAFAAVYLVWGSTFLAIRYAVQTIPPFSMMAARPLARVTSVMPTPTETSATR